MADFVAKVFLHWRSNSFGRKRDFSVKMWGTSSPDDKLTGDLCNVIEATSIGGRRSDFFTARKLAPGNLGLLQQYLPQPDSCTVNKKDPTGRDNLMRGAG
jgi:hypothetical protein